MRTKNILIILLLVLTLHGVSRSSDLLSAGLPAVENSINPGLRRGHCLVYDVHRRQVLLIGGHTPPNQPQLDELWSWKGTSWRQLPSLGPVTRSLSAVVYDTRRKRVVLFGGVGIKGYDELKGDTWEWDGKTWRQMSDNTTGTRDHHVMTYDSSRGVSVMYGGQTSDRSWASDTWEWNGAKWTRINTPGPGGRAHFAMAYDSKRKRTVLFGGMGEDSQYRNDTWEWDGSVWRKLSDEGPSARARHRMAFDSRNGVVILYGGNKPQTAPGSGFQVLEDMWTWDGSRWTEIKPTPNPGKRFMHAMAFDSARRRTVLYGGGDGQTTLTDTWEWDGKQWTSLK